MEQNLLNSACGEQAVLASAGLKCLDNDKREMTAKMGMDLLVRLIRAELV